MVSNMVQATVDKNSGDFFQKTKSHLFSGYQTKSLIIFAFIMWIFCFFMFLPILSVSVSAFDFSDLSHPFSIFSNFVYIYESNYYRNSVLNALYVALTTTILCSLIGLSVTIIFSRYEFYGKKPLRFLTIFPLISPPFIGALAITTILGRNGLITNFLKLFIPGIEDLLGTGLLGIVLIQSIHLWPLVFFNTTASYGKIDPAQEEQAKNLGSKGLHLYRKIILPLITPGFVAGAVLVFIFSIGDIGTPLVLNTTLPFAPLIAFTEIRDRSRALNLGASLALVIVILLISLLALVFSSKFVGMKDYTSEKVSGLDQSRMMVKASRGKTIVIWIMLLTLYTISLLPHIGVFILAFVQRIKYGEYFPTLWSFAGVETGLTEQDVYESIINTLLYSFLAMIFTIIIGIIIAFLIVRKKNLKGVSTIMLILGAYVGLFLGSQIASKIGGTIDQLSIMLLSTIVFSLIFYAVGKSMNVRCLEFFATMPFAVPGIVLAVGYINFFVNPDSLWALLPSQLDLIPILGFFTSHLRSLFLANSSMNNLLTARLTSYWFILVISYTMRRMPYAVLSSVAILRQIHESLEEQAFNLGSSTNYAYRKITIPLMAGGLTAGGLLTFVTSFTEVSTSLLIVPNKSPISPIYPITSESVPLTRAIYDQITRGNQNTAGVEGLVQLLVAAACMLLVQKILGDKTGTAFGGG